MGQISSEIQYSNDGCAVCSSGMFRGLLITSFIFALWHWHKLEQGETHELPVWTVFQSFPPEICSLICQDPILERLELNSICFISHAFRNEAQRELSSRFPCLRGASQVKTWCRSLKSRPHLATNIKGLVLLLPQLNYPAPSLLGSPSLTCVWPMCVNMKELVVLYQEPHWHQPGVRQYPIIRIMLWPVCFTVNGSSWLNLSMATSVKATQCLQNSPSVRLGIPNM